MKKFISGSFNLLRNLFYLCKIFVVFSILMLLFEWVEHLLGTNWTWLNFIRPFLNSILGFSESINKGSMDLWGALFEYKYGIALIIFVVFYYIMNGLIYLTSMIEDIFANAYTLYKKVEEKNFNSTLQHNVIKEEMQIKKYSVAIKTQVKKKFKHQELNIDLNEQNILMNKFIIEKLSIVPKEHNGGFLYEFNDFNKIDFVLDILFKVLKSTAPIEYAIVIQAHSQPNQIYPNIDKLMSLDYYGKIIMLAETSFRYKYNKFHKYQTSQVGIFQSGEKTIEIHEFKEIM